MSFGDLQHVFKKMVEFANRKIAAKPVIKEALQKLDKENDFEISGQPRGKMRTQWYKKEGDNIVWMWTKMWKSKSRANGSRNQFVNEIKLLMERPRCKDNQAPVDRCSKRSKIDEDA
eukprot:8779742-Karenia_brevis.AAC.1